MPSEIIDQANELAQQRLDLAIQAHRINHNAVSATHCDECGDAIEEARRIAVPGCQTCAECQGIIELKRKQRGM
ncbi:TraR/DksA family transcriptional regulator [Salmonella enterica]|uniref:TraR/DksA family transcriptional regulator n=1 Tax=Salmonella TaxID=590 RepID=UPI000B5DD7B5|nr:MULTISPECIES: TraR/DksA family transcriptional regulator [Salmonella]ASN57584.1 conjugal transfer protein TraR [Salmonella enterica subsp. enterica serovar Indiana]EEJ2275905.1 TraR/DksA family transcriptional regulator [Salmonella enterica subsp. enterica]MBJ5712887.1 TraR/DksA family transcriptional regulator [Salmonella enterica subsp. enterica serovar Indiana]MBJ6087429.1 TraR/DksA family transcriptional regulator [Salmonella enterica subsp. enterica serovar Indiana]MBM8358822.1 TraR/Dk